MKFVIDAQLPFKLASFLTKIGHQAIHTSDLPNKNFSEDNEIISYSEANEAVVITKDVDFLNSFVIHGKPQKLVIIRTGNISNKALLELFDLHIEEIILAIEDSHVIELFENKIVVLY